ncbi:MAG TPA: TerB family tellurite resistance protein [Aliidongia sp.]|nr:TerB family tellurite resistance protein [Aliidongia sp.]
MSISLIDRLTCFILGEEAPASDGDGRRLAVAALLVQAARMDDHFEPAERTAILRLLRTRFGLDQTAAEHLLALAERAEARAAGLYRFAKSVIDAFTPEERVGVIEMMWEVAYADGVLDPEEDALVRRIAGLIHVEDRDRGAARLRALARLGRV